MNTGHGLLERVKPLWLWATAAAFFQTYAGAADLGAGRTLPKTSEEEILRHTRRLASDEFEGRGPGTEGEDRTVRYLVEEFMRLRLKPGNPDGTFVQTVPLVGIRSEVAMEWVRNGEKRSLQYPQDYVLTSPRLATSLEVEGSELVFVGYGVEAPEYGWDDYKGADVEGKTLLMLVNDPPLPDPQEPGRLDPKQFGGKAMTYYGRWSYKFEKAAEKKAAAVLVIHETGPAGYPYFVVINSWGRENFDLKTADGNQSLTAVRGWMSLERARALMTECGQDFDRLKAAAARRDFRPVSLEGKATFRVKNTVREVQSRNVIARWEGRDPRVRDEELIYTSHWDHLGKDPKLTADPIFNGAFDNATGTAGLIELARAFTRLEERPRRSVVFLAVTAEEQGLLGSRYYAAHPLRPLHRAIANINMDGLNPWGITRDVVVVGEGQSTLEDVLRSVAGRQGRVIVPDPEPEKGFYYRSDHFEFAKAGVPALYVNEGKDYPGKPSDFGLKKREEFTANDYHKPSDQIKPDWDLAGAAADLDLLFEVGLTVTDADTAPAWKPGSEFRRAGEALRQRAGGK